MSILPQSWESSSKATLFIAHGSREKQTHEEFEVLIEQIRLEMGSQMSVAGAFLSLGTPSVDEALMAMAQAGIDNIRVIPLFVFSGKHIQNDLPTLTQAFKAQNPHIRIDLMGPMCAWPIFSHWLKRMCE